MGGLNLGQLAAGEVFSGLAAGDRHTEIKAHLLNHHVFFGVAGPGAILDTVSVVGTDIVTIPIIGHQRAAIAPRGPRYKRDPIPSFGSLTAYGTELRGIRNTRIAIAAQQHELPARASAPAPCCQRVVID
ncbi:MAG: hypothetical protein EBR00_08160 [Gammaproteobacteria bacterium]|nr:hypothetical protein [Gammaproteobacteria bacterium]